MPPERSPWWIKRGRGARAGSVAVETALLAPVILLMLAGAVDYGGAVQERMALVGAVRSGLQYALHHSTDSAQVELAVRGALSGDADTVSVTISQLCECPNGSTVSCSGACAVGERRRSFVDIDVQRSHATLLAWPGIENPTSLTATGRVRIQ